MVPGSEALRAIQPRWCSQPTLSVANSPLSTTAGGAPTSVPAALQCEPSKTVTDKTVMPGTSCCDTLEAAILVIVDSLEPRLCTLLPASKAAGLTSGWDDKLKVRTI